MRKHLLVAIAATVLVGAQAHALSITPTTGTLGSNRWDGPGVPSTGSGTSNILEYIQNTLKIPLNELYKMNVDDSSESGSLKDSYSTSFNGDKSASTITYSQGNFVGPNSYLLVKDGNHTPIWYLYWLADADLSNGDQSLRWNGTATLDLSGFWPGSGSISHVSLYGTSTTGGGGGGDPVPEPGTLLLLGSGLLGLAGIGRRSGKK